MLYYVYREDGMVLADIGSRSAQVAWVPYGTRAAAFYSLQAALLRVKESKMRAYAVAEGELPPGWKRN